MRARWLGICLGFFIVVFSAFAEASEKYASLEEVFAALEKNPQLKKYTVPDQDRFWPGQMWPAREGFLARGTDRAPSPARRWDNLRSSAVTNIGLFEAVNLWMQALGRAYDGGIQAWHGLCDGWSLATALIPSPQNKVRVIAEDQKVLAEFTPDQIKALFSVFYSIGFNYNLNDEIETHWSFRYPNDILWLLNLFLVDFRQQQKPLIGQLSINPKEVWNHNIMSYEMTLSRESRNQRTLRIKYKYLRNSQSAARAERSRTTPENFWAQREMKFNFSKTTAGLWKFLSATSLPHAFWLPKDSLLQAKDYFADNARVDYLRLIPNIAQIGWIPITKDSILQSGKMSAAAADKLMDFYDEILLGNPDFYKRAALNPADLRELLRASRGSGIWHID